MGFPVAKGVERDVLKTTCHYVTSPDLRAQLGRNIHYQNPILPSVLNHDGSHNLNFQFKCQSTPPTQNFSQIVTDSVQYISTSVGTNLNSLAELVSSLWSLVHYSFHLILERTFSIVTNIRGCSSETKQTSTTLKCIARHDNESASRQGSSHERQVSTHVPYHYNAKSNVQRSCTTESTPQLFVTRNHVCLIGCAGLLAIATVVAFAWWNKFKQEAESQEAVKRNAQNLKFQRERFKQALALDSVSLELPSIKEELLDPNNTVILNLVRARGNGAAAKVPDQQWNPEEWDKSTKDQWSSFVEQSKVLQVRDLWSSAVRDEAPKMTAEAAARMTERIRNANMNADGTEFDPVADARKFLGEDYEPSANLLPLKMMARGRDGELGVDRKGSTAGVDKAGTSKPLPPKTPSRGREGEPGMNTKANKGSSSLAEQGVSRTLSQSTVSPAGSAQRDIRPSPEVTSTPSSSRGIQGQGPEKTGPARFASTQGNFMPTSSSTTGHRLQPSELARTSRAQGTVSPNPSVSGGINGLSLNQSRTSNGGSTEGSFQVQASLMPRGKVESAVASEAPSRIQQVSHEFLGMQNLAGASQINRAMAAVGPTGRLPFTSASASTGALVQNAMALPAVSSVPGVAAVASFPLEDDNAIIIDALVPIGTQNAPASLPMPSAFETAHYSMTLPPIAAATLAESEVCVSDSGATIHSHISFASTLEANTASHMSEYSAVLSGPASVVPDAAIAGSLAATESRNLHVPMLEGGVSANLFTEPHTPSAASTMSGKAEPASLATVYVNTLDEPTPEASAHYSIEYPTPSAALSVSDETGENVAADLAVSTPIRQSAEPALSGTTASDCPTKSVAQAPDCSAAMQSKAPGASASELAHSSPHNADAESRKALLKLMRRPSQRNSSELQQ